MSKKEVAKLGDAEAVLLALGELQGGVPMPLIKDMATRQRRSHTQYQENPYTGEREIVAVMDPNNPAAAMRSEFGNTPTALGRSEILQADEIVSENALKLMHDSVENQPFKMFHQGLGRNVFPADFKVRTKDGVPMNVDAMQISEDSDFIDLLSHSSVAEKRGRYAGTIPQTQAMLDRELAKGKNVFQAVEDLDSAGRLLSNLATKSGKLVKGDSTKQMPFVERYHQLIMPSYTDRVRRGADGQQPRDKVVPPSGFMGVNLDHAVRAIKAGEGLQPQVKKCRWRQTR